MVHNVIITTARLCYLGIVGLLNLLLVDAELILMLATEVSQSLSQLTVELLLSTAVNFHHTRLMPTLRLAQLLQHQTPHNRNHKSLQPTKVLFLFFCT